MKKKIIIFGRTGFIGINLLKKLCNLYRVTSVSRKIPTKINRIKNVNYMDCDVSKLKDLKKINSEYDFIINLSGNIDHKNKTQTLKTHFNGCKNILKIF